LKKVVDFDLDSVYTEGRYSGLDKGLNGKN
jgi:hypothetical protein